MANYLNFTKAIFNPYNPKVLNEGQFSWITYDTDKQIGSERENTIDVYMYDNEGNQWYEKGYEGYGEFGNMDYYELLAKMNGFSEEDLVKKYKGKDMRDIGIDLAFGKLKTKAKGNKVLFPALVEDPKFNWKRHDFTQEAESDPNQSWYQEEESDDDYDDDYEQGWYESLKANEGAMSEIDIMAKEAKDEEDFKKKFYKEYGAKLKKSGETDEWIKELYGDATNEESTVTEAKFVKDFDKDVLDAEYKADITTYYPSVKFFIGKSSHFFGELEPNLYFKAYYKDYVNKNGGKIKGDFKIVTVYSEKGRDYVDLFSRSVDESADVITEARSINKISKDLEKTVLSMKTTVDEWKEADGDRKSELLEKLRELNKQKAKLEKELNDAVAGKDHDLQLALTEAEELAYLELDVINILND